MHDAALTILAHLLASPVLIAILAVCIALGIADCIRAYRWDHPRGREGDGRGRVHRQGDSW